MFSSRQESWTPKLLRSSINWCHPCFIFAGDWKGQMPTSVLPETFSSLA